MVGIDERPCSRCQHLVPLERGHLVYCSNCGAPQVFLSEELQGQIALEAKRHAERGSDHEEAGPGGFNSENQAAPGAFAMHASAAGGMDTAAAPPSRLDTLRRGVGAGEGRWPLAVESALLSSGIALGLSLSGLLFAPLLLLAWLWIVSAPILAVSFYNARARRARLSPGFAARLGLLTGVLVGVSCAAVLVLSLVLARYVLHNAAIDGQIVLALAQVRTNAQAQYGSAAGPMLHLLTIPEFRAGFMLWVCAVSAALYLLLSAVSAGLTGILLSRRRTA